MNDDQRDNVRLEGYIARHGEHEVYGGPAAGGWVEQTARAAWEAAVAANPELPLRVNFGGVPIGTAKLSVDDTGVKMEATLDAGYSLVVRRDHWDDDYTDRRILALSLHELSISPRKEEPHGEASD